MSFLLKEVLKYLCGEYRWSYAVFWKIGYRNPTLLVWEEYHYEPSRDSAIRGIAQSQFPQVGYQAEDVVCLLINKMMINNGVHVVGEGIVGRAAFTGDHQWILQENSTREGYPLEILNELRYQFSSSMQTIAVIPVLPHGVVQLGSTLAIAENMGFVQDVKNLFAQIGGEPGAPLSDNYTNNGHVQKIGAPTSLGVSISTDPFSATGNQEISISQASGCVSQSSYSIIMQTRENTQTNALALQTTPSLSTTTAKSLSDLQIKALPVVKPNLPFRGQLETGAVVDQLTMSSADPWLNQWASPYSSSSRFNQQLVQSGSCNSLLFMEQQILSGSGLQESVNNGLPASNCTNASQLRSNGGKIHNSLKDSAIFSLLGGSESIGARNDLQMLTSNPCGSAVSSTSFHPLEGFQLTSSNMSAVPVSDHGSLSNNNYVLPGVSLRSHPSTDDNHTQIKCTMGQQVIQNDLFQSLNIPSAHSDEYISSRCHLKRDFLNDCWVSSMKHDKGGPRSENAICDDTRVGPPLGDDLFGILGSDYKSRQLCDSWKDLHIHGADANTQIANTDVSACITQIDTGLEHYPMNVGIFSETGSGHLLDAVVSKVYTGTKQNSDDNVSCKTTLTKISDSSVLSDSPTFGALDQKQEKLFALPSPLAKAPTTGLRSFKSACTKDNAGECSQVNSIYSSQISSLGEDGQNMNRDNSISTANSKRPHETGKTNRKRLKPGESPRPRPKDRQMIQDRVKELREIVPNGAKCSIDTLLERTIKHMLFLQSVTKHADMLKQTGESKIVNKESGLLLKDNFEGGATWAFEVGSQTMVCPIIVEDLNPPRQMLVEMLCEERGFFLEIADMVRGLGLTILKGEMEARNDKVWVRFTVEANRDVTRMEIFLSLVHLLEQAGKTLTSKITDSANMMVHNTFHQASVPVTGASNSLQ